jgi:hypothetical protein
MATGQLKCDECKGIIEHGERYMLEGEEGKEQRWCLNCCQKKGEAADVKEKGEKHVTFFPPSKFDK